MSRTRRMVHKVKENDVILNSRPNHLYSHDFEHGRFFQVVHDNSEGFQIQLSSRIMFRAVYIKEENDIEGIEIIKLDGQNEKQRVKFNKFNLGQLRAFLEFLDSTDLAGISSRRIELAEGELTQENKSKIKTLLALEGGKEMIETLVEEGIITSRDIINIKFRQRAIRYFNQLLYEEDYWKSYRDLIDIPKAKEESVWQAYFERNEWIFGFGLDYKFQGIAQREGNVSEQQLDGTGSTYVDFLLSDTRFVTFVELKKPSTPLFGSNSNRSGAWSLSRDLQDAVSQILEQKAAGLIKFEKPQYDEHGNVLKEKAYDSETILIIGKWQELEECTAREAEIKKSTFELYRRNLRNVKIYTYDELYDRAQFMVNHLSRKTKTTNG